MASFFVRLRGPLFSSSKLFKNCSKDIDQYKNPKCTKGFKQGYIGLSFNKNLHLRKFFMITLFRRIQNFLYYKQPNNFVIHPFSIYQNFWEKNDKFCDTSLVSTNTTATYPFFEKRSKLRKRGSYLIKKLHESQTKHKNNSYYFKFQEYFFSIRFEVGVPKFRSFKIS